MSENSPVGERGRWGGDGGSKGKIGSVSSSLTTVI